MSDETEHGVESTYYSGGHGNPYYQPVMQCLCGWNTERQASWEEAGAAFDEHLADVDKRTAKKARKR